MAEATPGRGILDGYRVVEVAEHTAGPIAGGILADLGADVIKVERPAQGDPSRYLQDVPPGDYSGAFLVSNRGKRSLVVDLKTVQGRAALDRLIDTADVFLTNYRGTARRALRVDRESVLARNPNVVYADVSGYGSNAEAEDLPAFDTVAIARSGLLSEAGAPVGRPLAMKVYAADTATGYFTALGVVSALLARERAGGGQVVETSMLRSSVCFLPLNVAGHYMREARHGQAGTPPATRAGGFSFLCSDGRAIVVHLVQSPERFWRSFLSLVGRSDLLEQPQFATAAGRATNNVELSGILQEVIGTRPAAEWLGLLEESGVPCSPLNTTADLAEDELVASTGSLAQIQHQNGMSMRIPASPFSVDGWRTEPRGPAPLAGEHTLEIMQMLRYSNDEITAARQDGWALAAEDIASTASVQSGGHR